MVDIANQESLLSMSKDSELMETAMEGYLKFKVPEKSDQTVESGYFLLKANVLFSGATESTIDTVTIVEGLEARTWPDPDKLEFPGVVNHDTAVNLINASLLAPPNVESTSSPKGSGNALYESPVFKEKNGAEIETASEAKKPAATTTSRPKASEEVPIFENANVMGCKWPNDYRQRVDFCFDHAGLEKPETDVVYYGLLDGHLVDTYTKNCINGSTCPGEVDHDRKVKFLEYWLSNKDKFVPFKECLRSNTEGMVRLCDPKSKVGTVTSGTAGLHLNLLQVLIGFEHVIQEGNWSTCSLKLAEVLHITASFYLHNKEYQENTVLCWESSVEQCSKKCAKFATELYCLKDSCSNITSQDFESFGIWQWYYMHSTQVQDRCHLEGSEKMCSESAALQPRLFNTNETFTENVRRKFNDVKVALEGTFNMPFHIVLAIMLSILVVFIAIVALGCMWYHGLIFADSQRAKMRYSSLLGPRGGNPDEMRSLATEDDDYE